MGTSPTRVRLRGPRPSAGLPAPSGVPGLCGLCGRLHPWLLTPSPHRAELSSHLPLLSLPQSRWVGAPVGHTRTPPLPAARQALACAARPLRGLPLAPGPGQAVPHHARVLRLPLGVGSALGISPHGLPAGSGCPPEPCTSRGAQRPVEQLRQRGFESSAVPALVVKQTCPEFS